MKTGTALFELRKQMILRKSGAEWFLMWEETWFQTLGPQTHKARFPNWVRVLTTVAALVVEERSWRR